jgi:hypothetical protein
MMHYSISLLGTNVTLEVVSGNILTATKVALVMNLCFWSQESFELAPEFPVNS